MVEEHQSHTTNELCENPMDPMIQKPFTTKEKGSLPATFTFP